MPAVKLENRGIDPMYDFLQNTFAEPGKEERKHHTPSPSEAVNTLGEVPDSDWFTNRIGSKPMTIAEMLKGPGHGRRSRDRQALDRRLGQERRCHAGAGDQGFGGAAILSEIRSGDQSRNGQRGGRCWAASSSTRWGTTCRRITSSTSTASNWRWTRRPSTRARTGTSGR